MNSPSSTVQGVAPETFEPGPAVHDFDFYMGTWAVHHRRLVKRLAGSDDWAEFEGTSTAWPILDGAGNIDDNVLELPDGEYRAISLRTYDPVTTAGRSGGSTDGRPPGSTRRWSAASWTASARSSRQDTFDGRPILVRFLWSDITATTCRWEQAFSTDGGATWEVNWVMTSTRSPEARLGLGGGRRLVRVVVAVQAPPGARLPAVPEAGTGSGRRTRSRDSPRRRRSARSARPRSARHSRRGPASGASQGPGPPRRRSRADQLELGGVPPQDRDQQRDHQQGHAVERDGDPLGVGGVEVLGEQAGGEGRRRRPRAAGAG